MCATVLSRRAAAAASAEPCEIDPRSAAIAASKLRSSGAPSALAIVDAILNLIDQRDPDPNLIDCIQGGFPMTKDFPLDMPAAPL